MSEKLRQCCVPECDAYFDPYLTHRHETDEDGVEQIVWWVECPCGNKSCECSTPSEAIHFWNY